MKKIHYINIGMAKTGSTAVFESLIEHPHIDYNKHKEFNYLPITGYPLSDYIDYYSNFDVSINFCVATWAIDSKQIHDLKNIGTHFSIIFRNPYDFILSLYNYLPPYKTTDIQTIDTFIEDTLFEQNALDYSKILKRWEPISSSKPFKILYYEDLLADPSKFLNSIGNFLNLPEFEYPNSFSNVTNYHTEQYDFLPHHVNKINGMIEEFEDYTKQLTTWKKHV